MLVVVTITLIAASWLSFLMPVAIGNYSDIIRALGSNLPPSTRLLLTSPRAWQIFVVLAVPLFLWVIARSRVTRLELGRMKLAIRLLILALLLAYAFAAWAIYIPMIRRGEVM